MSWPARGSPSRPRPICVRCLPCWTLRGGRWPTGWPRPGDQASVRIVPDAEGRVRLSVERLDAVGEPASLVELARDQRSCGNWR
jgi:hypothetical protein